MEKYLFYMYLKYIKENELTFWQKFFKMPKHIICLVVGVLISAILAVVATFVQILWLICVSILAEAICCIALNVFIERYQINFSEISYEEYKKYCIGTLSWLKKFDLSDDEIISMHERIEKQILSIKEEQKRNSEHVFKWLQALIIPVIVSIVTTIIAKETSVTNMVVYAAVILILFAILYGIGVAVKSLMLFPEKRKIEQMECFASDLQGAIDCRKYVEGAK